MKTSTIAVLLFLLIPACDSNHNQFLENVRPFDVTFTLDATGNGEAVLNFEILLDTGNYFVSPHTDGFHQRLIFSIEDTDSLLLMGELHEHPLALEDFDPLSEKQGKFVRTNTTYSQSLKVGAQTDFHVGGLIWLEMRPSCQPYEVPFTITHTAGQLTLTQSDILLSGYPTFWDKKRLDIPLNEMN